MPNTRHLGRRVLSGAVVAVVLLGAACSGDDTADPADDADAGATATTGEPTDQATETEDEVEDTATSTQYAELDADNQAFMDRICTGARDPSTYSGDIGLAYNMVRAGERGIPELDEAWRDLDANEQDALLAAAGPVCDAIGWTPEN